jgi:HipA-like C-terminal domain
LQKVPVDPVKFYADYQLNWAALIPPLRRGRFLIEEAQNLSIHGDAPKFFVKAKEYREGHPTRGPGDWPKYIAKVGSKWYPIESITERLIARIGECFAFVVAESDLRMIGRQVRFMSRYFLRPQEQLAHGVEIFAQYVEDRAMIEEIAASRLEQEFYTFQTVSKMIAATFPRQCDLIMVGLVEMIAYDAIVGNNDRHPANWGIVVGVRRDVEPRFSPIFDTARGLFWNCSEGTVRRMAKEPAAFDAYVRKCYPQIGWDGVRRVNHFELIQRIWGEFPQYRPVLARLTDGMGVAAACRVVVGEFGHLLSNERLTLIQKCLTRRHELFCASLHD